MNVKTCSVDDCEKQVGVKDLCVAHYHRQRRHGTFDNRMGLRAAPTEARFWENVDKSGGPDACWPWTGYCDEDGYGQFWFRKRQQKAHRVAFTLTKGEITPGMDVIHSCDNPPCCNPKCLSEGTHADNMRDMYAKNRWTRRPRALRVG